MRHLLPFALIITSSVLLSACDVSMNHSSTLQKVVHDEKLQDGSSLKVGYQEPLAAWQCTQIFQEKHNFAAEQIKSTPTQTNAMAILQNEAVQYANAHLKNHINYVYIYMPNEVSAGFLDSSLWSNTITTYYRCVHPPAAHGLFS